MDIQKALADPDGVFVQPAAAVKPKKRTRLGLPWVAAIVVAAVIVTGILVWKLKPAEPRRVSSFSQMLPDDQNLYMQYRSLAISPDGRKIIYSTPDGLYLRSLDELEANLIRGSDTAAMTPFFSPDSQWVGYWSENDQQLKRIAVNGGTPIVLCNAISAWGGASWGGDNKIVFSCNGEIMRVSADGGTPEMLIKPEGEYFWDPEILPGGKSVIFTLGLVNKLVAQSLESSERTELLAGTSAHYLPTGHLIYGVDNSLYAVSFDPDTLTATGGQVPVVEGVAGAIYLTEPQYFISESGTLVYVPGGDSSRTQLKWYDRQGNKLELIGEPAPYEQFSLSPDEKRVVIERRDSGTYDLWLLELSRGGVPSRITFEPTSERDPIWSPDGNFIAYNSNRNGPDDLYKIYLATGEKVELLSDPQKRLIAEDWSKDGQYIIYSTSATSDAGLWSLSMAGDEAPRPIVRGKFTYDEPKLSPDGKWLAYISNESGNYQVYLTPFEGEGEKQIISTQGGGQPHWRNDGKELYYLAPDGWLMAVELKGEPPEPGNPKRLFQTGISVIAGLDQYAVTGDGQRFLILNSEKEEQESSITIVLNWFEELKKRVPVP